EIYDPPTIIYYKGNLDFNNDKGLAIVGSRKHSAYGEKVIDSLLKDLSSSKLTVISGLASGIDSLAHEKALENNLKTIAVLGTSLEEENIFPAENFSLAKSILANNGALVSEFPPKTKGFKQNFPMRNRIISGLSQAVLVIEAKERSGSLITVNQALDQGREVMTIPGNIFSEFSSGTNKLLASGARLITKGEDVLDFFLNKNLIEDKSREIIKKDILLLKKKPEIKLENKNEEIVYDLIKIADERAEKINTEEIVKKTKLDIATINSTLSILELKSLIKKSYNNYNLS
ncbi:DNA-processing protein DprA, partial [Patescibacteria group bacterium]|nr:DNA-processing protein DprA [Patescibacteria group bacterium]